MANHSPKQSGYIPSLDGWRAAAILIVIAFHDMLVSHTTLPNSYKDLAEALGDVGFLGVSIFFSLSGLLICSRLLADEQRYGQVRLKAFYVRRLFRIQPAALAYLFVIAALCLSGLIHESLQARMGALFSFQNYIFSFDNPTGDFAFTGHFWTLAVEEHFYIALPLLFFLFRKSRWLVFSSFLLAVIIFQRYAIRFNLYSSAHSTRETQWVIQFFLIAVLLALLLQIPFANQQARRWLHPWVAYLITFIGYSLWAAHRFWGGLNWYIHGFYVGPNGVLPYFFGLCIVSTMLHPNSWSTRLLETPPLRFVGRLSYSLYLWHILYFVPAIPQLRVDSPFLHILAERPWRYIASIGSALLCYYWIEKPFLRWGHRLAPPATPGHTDLDESTSATEKTFIPGLISKP